MKAYVNHNAEGQIVSFEISNIGRSRVCRFIDRTIPSANVNRQQSDDFCTFQLNGRRFVISEPWSDSSRYLIHEETPQPSVELETLRSAFENYRPPFWALFG